LLRSLVLLSLSAILPVACATSPAASPADSAVQGSLGSGGAAQASRSDGTHWALSVVGSDVLLDVDGARVRFLDGAPGGRLAYEHDEATATWRLRLASGLAVCQGHDLEFAGRCYRLREGTTHRFDGKGSLE